MLTIDGAEGEGGGQLLRSALALSMITGEPFRMLGVRAGRAKPGLMRQHLTAVQAAAAVSGARVVGDAVGSTELRFEPGATRGGDYRFAVGTAGSATLVFQTVLPALMLADAPSKLVLEGGTHNAAAPPFDFLAQVFAPLIERMGPRLGLRLERHGFYPAGGGRFVARVTPQGPLTRLDLRERGPLRARRARALVAALPRAVGHRELRALSTRGWQRDELSLESIEGGRGPGNVLMLTLESAHITELFTAFGERGRPAEAVAEAALHELDAYLASGAPVGPHLADQLLLPFALAGGGSLCTQAPTLHTRTQAAVIERFLGLRTRMEAIGEDRWLLELGS